jgi:hypothetical protein
MYVFFASSTRPYKLRDIILTMNQVLPCNLDGLYDSLYIKFLIVYLVYY